jgi:predicted enzyme related to lactoylglutathione lyase
MSLNFNSIMIGTSQPKVMSEFYEKVFAKAPDMVDPTGAGWQIGSSFFGFGEHSEVEGANKEPARMMCNFETTDVQAEFDRIKATGATVIKEPYEMEGANGMIIATFADPDGNYFQLMSPWKEG